jgi:segregation and condensation protein A
MIAGASHTARKRFPMDQPAYRVQLDSYEGPLDLLLYLVRRAEVEIVDLPLAKIVGQFHEFLDVLQAIDLDEIGEFVLMASTLAEIKSREVLPRNDDGPVEAEEERPLDAANPRSELIHRLLEHKRFKDAAKTLEERAAQWQERYPRLSDDRPTAGKDHSADRIKDVELWDLISALGRVLKRKDVEDVGRIRYDDTPIHVYVEQIGTRIRQSPGLVFSSLLEPESQRSKIVGMFLAVLELLRHHGFRAAQSADFGEITMYPPLDDAPAADAES